MATVKDRPLEESCILEDSKTFVLNWLSDAPRSTRIGEQPETVATRIEDILDELQGDNGYATMKIRLR